MGTMMLNISSNHFCDENKYAKRVIYLFSLERRFKTRTQHNPECMPTESREVCTKQTNVTQNIVHL